MNASKVWPQFAADWNRGERAIPVWQAEHAANYGLCPNHDIYHPLDGPSGGYVNGKNNGNGNKRGY